MPGVSTAVQWLAGQDSICLEGALGSGASSCYCTPVPQVGGRPLLSMTPSSRSQGLVQVAPKGTIH
jgi:hypothetical protein